MNDELLTSRFFKTDDKRADTIVFPLPSHWWSRYYEYAWAAEFCKPTDVVLDAACGIAHPFKFWLAEHCKAVHALDKDERILDREAISAEMRAAYGIDNIELTEEFDMKNFKQGDITVLPYRSNMFDKIFCISVLEHIPDADKAKALAEFCRVLKKAGQIILTLDYPDTTIDKIEAMANEAGLKLAGEKDPTIPVNAICMKNHNLYCFRMVLVKG